MSRSVGDSLKEKNMSRSVGDSLRSLGDSIQEAMTTPARLRLEADNYKRKLDKENEMKEREKTALEVKKRASDSIRSQYGDTAADLYMSGESLSGIASLKNADANYLKALRSGGNKSAKERYAETFKGMELLDKQLTEFQGSLAEKALTAQKEGRSVADEMSKVNGIFDEIESKIVPDMIELKKVINEPSGMVKKVAEGVSNKLKDLDEEEIELVTKSVYDTLSKKLGVSQASIEKISKLGKSRGIDLSNKIGSVAEIQQGALESYFNKEISMGELQDVLGSDEESIDSYKDRLIQMVKDNSRATDIQKSLASEMLKNLQVMEVIGSTLGDMNLSDQELIPLTYDKQDEFSSFAKKEQKKRAAKKYGNKKSPSSYKKNLSIERR